MVSRVPFRNPYPVPDVSSEGFWLPPGPILGDKVTIDDRRWYSKLDIHERLFAHHTLNSIRKDQRLIRTKAPRDALDLALTSAYVHNEDTLVPKMYVSMQPESLGRETWRVLRNELKTSSPQFGIPSSIEEIDYEQFSETFDGDIEANNMVAGAKMVARARTADPTRMAARAGTADAAKMAARARTADGTKTAARSRTVAGSKMATRAVSAPGSTFGKAQREKPHRYAGRTRHDGIPDRIERIHPSSLKLAIQGPHTDQTNAGFSRKEDGTFYGV